MCKCTLSCIYTQKKNTYKDEVFDVLSNQLHRFFFEGEPLF